MIGDVLTIAWRELTVLRRRLAVFLFARMISPLLYLATFGFGLGRSVQLAGGGSYLDFVVSGIIAMNSMLVCFNAVASPVCMSRILYMTFDEYQTAPISNTSYVLGQALAAAVRGLISSAIIIAIAWLFGCRLHVDGWYLLVLTANCLTFSFVGVIAAMLVDGHENLNTFTTYVITPMSFLCGTFFRLDNFPPLLAKAVYFLPLTPASSSLRAIGAGGEAAAADLLLLAAGRFLRLSGGSLCT